MDNLSGTLNKSLDAQNERINAKLQAHHDKVLALQSNQERSLRSVLDTQHGIQRKESASHQQAMISRLSSAGLEVIAHQKEMRRLAKQNCRYGSSLKKDMARSIKLSAKQHDQTKETISVLTSEIKQLRVSMGLGPSAEISYDRNILFFGQHSGMIMAYLLPLQNDLDEALENLMNRHSRDFSVDHAYWLQREFRRLVASAAQENATRFSESTARSIDQWSYPVQANNKTDLISGQKRKTSDLWHDSGRLSSKKPATMTRQSRIRHSNQLWSLETPSGTVHISLPPARPGQEEVGNGSEAGLSWTITQNRSAFAVNAHFRYLADKPKVQTQLSVFTRVENVSMLYWRLFNTGTISEIDFAYRNGTISPFHVDDTGSNYYLEVRGRAHASLNLFMYTNRHQYAVHNIRPDALVYLLNHGIHTSQIVNALDPANGRKLLEKSLLYSGSSIIHNPNMRSLIDHIEEEVVSSSQIFADVALTLCIQAYARRDWGIAWPLFISCVQKILRESSDQYTGLEDQWVNGDGEMHNRIWEYVPPRQIVSLIYAAGADSSYTYTGGRNAITYFMFLRFGRHDQEYCHVRFRTDVEFLSALLEYHSSCKLCFIEAQLSDCWHEWCDALESHGFSVSDVIRETGFVSCFEDFEARTAVNISGIIKKKSRRTGYYYTDDDESDDSDGADSDWADDTST